MIDHVRFRSTFILDLYQYIILNKPTIAKKQQQTSQMIGFISLIFRNELNSLNTCRILQVET